MDDLLKNDLLKNNYKRNIVLDLVLTLLLCGLWNLVVQKSQIGALNTLKNEPNRYGLIRTLLFSLLTCGLYFIYFEYKKAKDLADITQTDETSECLLAIVLTFFGFSWVYDAIFQSKLNQYIDSLKTI